MKKEAQVKEVIADGRWAWQDLLSKQIGGEWLLKQMEPDSDSHVNHNMPFNTTGCWWKTT